MRKSWMMAAGLVALAEPAWAQVTDAEPSVAELVVVGSRGAPRLATETAAPVDVLSGAEVAARGHNDLTKVLEFLSPSFNNAAAARFFTNAADTRTKGWEATLRWDGPVGPDARLAVTFGYGAFDTDVRRQATNQELPASPLLGPGSIDLTTDGQPRNKALLNAELTWAGWRFVGDLTRFGAYRTTSPLGGANQVIGGATSLDLSVAYRLRERFTVQAGVLNATDAYPDRLIGEATGRPFSEFDPLGVNGREYYVRLTAEF